MSLAAWRLALATLVLPASLALGASAAAETVGGAPLIPEPLVFDMVRPLAAPKGELEVNTLALFPHNAPGRKIDWAPEIEYAFMDGFAIEFELPFDGAALESYKLGFQGTFGTMANKRIVHGFQYLGIADKETGRLATTLVYIAGVRYTDKWSTLTMVGFDLPNDVRMAGEQRDDALVFNHSLFYEANAKTTAGVEINTRIGSKRKSWLVMPQVHQRLSKDIMLQAGFGAEKPSDRKAYPTSAVRLIKEF